MLTDNEVRDAIDGPWVAVLVDPEGRPLDVRQVQEVEELAVAVVRRSAAPANPGSVLPHQGRPEDTLYYHELVVGEDPVAVRWEQAKAAAAGMNLIAPR